MEYLQALGNDALSGLKLVLATHWHDDHIAGLASILESAPQATFCCSMALRHDEFMKLVQAAPQTIIGRSGVDEFSSILKILELRGEQVPVFAVENKRLNVPGQARSFPLRLEALSPSNRTIKYALAEIVKYLPKAGEPQRRIPNRTPNDTSVVLWVEAGGVRALLGADLEHAGKVGEGWMAVLDCHQDPVQAQFFKVPHHGSDDSDHAEVWQKMLTLNPVAVVTPFSAGNVRLPGDSNLKRLAGRTSRLYCTIEGAGKPPSRDPAVERVMRTAAPDRRVIEGRPGQVRVRWLLGEENPTASIEVFNGAFHVAHQN